MATSAVQSISDLGPLRMCLRAPPGDDSRREARDLTGRDVAGVIPLGDEIRVEGGEVGLAGDRPLAGTVEASAPF